MYIFGWVENSCLDGHSTVTHVEEYPKLFHSMCNSAKGITKRLVPPGWLPIFICACFCLYIIYIYMYIVSALSGKWD